MRVMVIAFAVGTPGTVPKRFEKDFSNWKSEEKVETLLIAALLGLT